MIRDDVAYEMCTMEGGKLRKGFTLIELLIVMVVIAILSVAMMLAAEEVSYSAYASTVINNLNIWKKAALAYYMDNIDKVSEPDFNLYNVRDDIAKYIDNAKEFMDYAKANKINYQTIQSKEGAWYIGVNIGGVSPSKSWSWGDFSSHKSNGNTGFFGVQAKLAAKAKSLGLLAASNLDWDRYKGGINDKGEKIELRTTHDIEYDGNEPRIYGTVERDHNKNCLLMRIR